MIKDPPIQLTQTVEADLEVLYRIQLDKAAIHLAAFTAPDSGDKSAYIKKHSRFLSDPSIVNRTIKIGPKIIGSIAQFFIENDAELTYWIDRNYWGQGIATAALREFLKIVKIRPLFGRVAFDNYGSQKVLTKNGFVKIGQDKGFANARQLTIEEYIYILDTVS